MTSHIAIADPNLAPYGRAARQVLQRVGMENFPVVQGKSVSQTATFIATGNTGGGFIALSQVKQMNVSESSYWLIPTDWHQPIEQQLVVLHDARPGYAELIAFLKSPSARAIITRAGYEVPDGD